MLNSNEHVVWPPKDEYLQDEADRLCNEMEDGARDNMHREENIVIDYSRLSMLLKLAIPKVPDGQIAFFDAVTSFYEMLPRCVARSFLKNIFTLDFDKFELPTEKIGAMMRLYQRRNGMSTVDHALESMQSSPQVSWQVTYQKTCSAS